MENITTFEQWSEIVEKEERLLLFVKTTGCSVCEGLYPQVAAIQPEFNTPFYCVNASDVPEMAGQLSLFTAPVVLVLHEGKEYSRFARFVQMDELKKRLTEVEQLGSTSD